MKRIIVGYTVLWLMIVVTANAQAVMPGNEVVSTAAGRVSGMTEDGITAFKSIPYAAAPVGELRFAMPVPHPRWDTMRISVPEGPTAPFNVPKDVDMDGFPVHGKGWIKGDEFLTVNIWKPSAIVGKLPVMVFIHGGAFVIGSKNGSIYNGANFARQGVVMITLNYRLGIEGFLKIPGVPANLGIRDQIAALHWVKENIAAFGGDPENITIFGESAGGMSVGVLMVSPAARGLFKRAIMISGSGQSVFSAEQAGRVAAAYARKLKMPNTRQAWMKLTPEEILAAQPKVTARMVNLNTEEYTDPSGGLVLFYPVIDGDIVPAMPLNLVAKSSNAGYLMIGYNTDEANLFLVPTKLMKPMKFDFILNKAVKLVHPAPSAAIAVYRSAYPSKNGGEVLSSIITAYQFQVPAIRFAMAHVKDPAHKTFMYEFNWVSPVAGGRYGAFHGVALPFIFNNTDVVKGEKGMLGNGPVPALLADNVQHAFVRFARTGNPGWDPYTAADQKTMLINEQWKIQTKPHQKELGIWSGIR